jgi:putative oxidoreductase
LGKSKSRTEVVGEVIGEVIGVDEGQCTENDEGMKTKIMNYFKPLVQPTSASTALLLLRIFAGVAFMLHGWGKIQNPMGWMPPSAPVPGFLQLLAAFAEFGGGLAWILGLLTPLASLGLAITMFVASLMHIAVLKDPIINMTGGSSAEPALGYLFIALVLMFVGPGKFSVDRKIFGLRS